MAKEITGQKTVAVDASAEQVWLKMQDFADLGWAVGIADIEIEGQGIGMVRRVRLEGSEDWLEERLLMVDQSTKKLEYGIDEGMMGITHYRATAQVIPQAQGCQIEWTCCGQVESSEVAEKEPILALVAEGIVTLFATQFSEDSR
ncbi:MAG: SRPBCC family protein [Pseudomonadales bacterium]